MKKKIATTLLFVMTLFSAWAQEFKVAKAAGRLEVNLGGATIEGYNGNELIFSSTAKTDFPEKENHDERAKGLRVISGSGLEDNTGLGINISDKGNVVQVSQVSKKRNGDLKIMVPKAMIVSFTYDKAINASPVHLKNMENEIEVSVQYNSVELENVTGPMSIKTVYGSVDAKFNQTVKGPVSVVSVYGHVDVAIPVTTKANISMKTSYGEIMAASDFKIDFEKTDDVVTYTSESVKGKINGGGTDIILKANYGKIYLRKN